MNKINHFKNTVINFIDRHRIWSSAIILFVLFMLFIASPAPPKPVLTEKVKKGDLVQSISITGTVTAEKSVDLSFQIAGKLAWLGVRKGDYVDTYQAIAVLDQRSAQKTLEKTLLDYSLARSTFDETLEDNQNRTPQEALNNEVKRILERNQWNLEKAVNSVELQDLVKQQSVLTSPIAGIVTRADVRVAGVNITGETVFTVTDPESLKFTMEVDEADISKVKENQKVVLTLDPFPDKNLELLLDSIDFVTHSTSTGGNAYNVEAKMPPNTDYQYRVGMNGNAQIIIARKDNVLIIPLSSIVNDDKVIVKTKADFRRKTIKIGLANDISAQVSSGLEEGDEVVIEPSSVTLDTNAGSRFPSIGRFLRIPGARFGR
ncbi:MAG: efflux RND transporter periplasmic adaptor subunit [Candidatus Levybacteria bacterium]|nr:efflux RND transporter periplasmic adaptor subunit [Candidatus Levybacteria bacterium]